MIGFARMLVAVAAISLTVDHAAAAEADITLAAIATGRLYVVGRTERPNTPVVLDGQFRTESNDKALFQYELVYHPSRCIVSALIDGKTHEAVVSNCGEACRPEGAGAAGAMFAPFPLSGGSPAAPTPGPLVRSPAAETTRPARSAVTAPPAPAVAPRAPSPESRSTANRDPRRTGAGERKPAQAVNPPLPPTRPAPRVESRRRPAQPDRDVESPGGEP